VPSTSLDRLRRQQRAAPSTSPHRLRHEHGEVPSISARSNSAPAQRRAVDKALIDHPLPQPRLRIPPKRLQRVFRFLFSRVAFPWGLGLSPAGRSAGVGLATVDGGRSRAWGGLRSGVARRRGRSRRAVGRVCGRPLDVDRHSRPAAGVRNGRSRGRPVTCRLRQAGARSRRSPPRPGSGPRRTREPYSSSLARAQASASASSAISPSNCSSKLSAIKRPMAGPGFMPRDSRNFPVR